MVKQNKSHDVMPIPRKFRREKARVPTEDERKHNTFVVLRQARVNVRLFGLREKKRREAEEKDK